MRGRILTLLFGISALSSHAIASFDLALVLDDGNRAIHRYDGDTGTYLGRINLPSGTTLQGMALDQANQRVFVGDNLGFHAYNYNTGQLLFSNFASNSPGGPLAYSPTYGLIRGSFNTVLGMQNPSASSTYNVNFPLFFVGGGGISTGGIAVDDTGDVVVLTGGSGVVVRVTPSATEYVGFVTPGAHNKIKVRGTSLLAARRSSTALLYGSSQDLAGIQASTTVGVASVQSVAFGHENVRYATGLNPTNTQQGMVSQFTVSSSGEPMLVMRQFGNGQLVNPIDMAVVVAPEPFTMIGLGAGVLALMRKCKRA